MATLSRQTKRQLILLALVLGVFLLSRYVGSLDNGHTDGGLRPDPGANSSTGSTGSTGSTVSVADLPPEARDTIRLIEAGGPFHYPRSDDKTFGNNEGHLPSQPRGYYREYTVVTPGSPDRGARRIIAGREGDWYYTSDHYASFRRIQGH